MSILVLLLLGAIAAGAQDRERISRDVRERAGVGLPPGVASTEEISAEDAVAIALWNNAGFQSALAGLGFARAEVVDAGLLRNLSFQILFPVAGKPFESLFQLPAEVLWQRRRRVAAARADFARASEALVQNGLDLVRDVRVACAELELAETRAGVAARAAELRSKIAELTDRRLAAGDISGMEALLPRIDARLTATLAERAAGERQLARDRLRLLLGLRQDRSALRLRALPAPPPLPPEWPQLLESAVASRPDLRAAELAVEAATLPARWEHSRILQTLAPALSVKETGAPSRTRAGPALQADLPLLNRNQGGRARADAEVLRAAAQYAVLRDRDGEASYLFVLEANRQVYDVELREAEEAAAARRAEAELERAIGRKW